MPESFFKHRNASSVEFLETMLIIRILNFCSSLHRLHKCYKLHYLTGKHGILFWTLFLRERELSWAATTMSVGINSIQSRVLQNNILTEFFLGEHHVGTEPSSGYIIYGITRTFTIFLC